MLSAKTIDFIFMLLFSLTAAAQNVTSTENFIAYRMPPEADSLLVVKLDSLEMSVINNHFVIRVGMNCRDKYSDYDYSISLCFLYNYRNDTMNFFQYLARNSNRYYVSGNKKYKLPVVLSTYDETFKYDYGKYRYPITDSPYRIFIELDVKMFTVVNVEFNNPIPAELRRKNE